MPLEDWLDSDYTPPARELYTCIDDLASQVCTALQKPDVEAEIDAGMPGGFDQYDPSVGNW